MNTKALALLATIVVAVSAAVVIASDDYDADASEPTIKEVDFYRLSEETPGKLALRYYDDMPNVPYMGICQLYKVYTGNDLTLSGEGGVYTVTNKKGSAVIDLGKNTLYSDDYRKFTELSMGGNDDPPAFAKIVEEEHSGPMSATLKFSDYNITPYYDEGDVYFPVSIAADIFMGTGGFMMLYVPGTPDSEPFIRMVDLSVVAGETPTILTPSYEKALLAMAKYDRAEDFARFSYDNLCFIVDNFYGKVSSSIIGSQMKTKTLDEVMTGTNDSNLNQIRKWLVSTSQAEYMAGLIGLQAYLFDGGHTAISTLVDLFRDPARCPELAPAITEELTKVTLPQHPDRNQKEAALKEARSAAWSDAASLGGEDTYISKGDTAVFTFNTFYADMDAWSHYVPGSTNYPEDSIGHFMKALNKAKADPSIKNFVIDLSCNGGGTVTVVLFMISMMTGDIAEKLDMDVQTGDISTMRIHFDTNLDGKFDKEDLKKQYDFNFAILTTSASFSSGNMLPVYAKDEGIMIIGEKSGGGICGLMIGSTADGLFGTYSSYNAGATKSGKDLEAGAEPDKVLIDSTTTDYSVLYDIDTLSKAMNDFYAKKGGSNTLIYVAIAIVVLVAIAAAVLFMRKKSAA